MPGRKGGIRRRRVTRKKEEKGSCLVLRRTSRDALGASGREGGRSRVFCGGGKESGLVSPFVEGRKALLCCCRLAAIGP